MKFRNRVMNYVRYQGQILAKPLSYVAAPTKSVPITRVPRGYII